ncbi:hypothetical protein COOONC_00616 [Cooperia oncophora]
MSVRDQGTDEIKGAESFYRQCQSKDDKVETLSDDVKELKKRQSVREKGIDGNKVAEPLYRQGKRNVKAEMKSDGTKQAKVAGLKQSRRDEQEFIQSEPMF